MQRELEALGELYTALDEQGGVKRTVEFVPLDLNKDSDRTIISIIERRKRQKLERQRNRSVNSSTV
jgi:hypothetical protein